jgi:hypothetical protein
MDISPLTQKEKEELQRQREAAEQHARAIEQAMVDTTMASAEEWLGKTETARFLKRA